MPIKEQQKGAHRIFIVVNPDGTRKHGSHMTLESAEAHDIELHGKLTKPDKLRTHEEEKQKEGRKVTTRAAKAYNKQAGLRKQLKDLGEGKEVDVDLDELVHSKMLELDKS